MIEVIGWIAVFVVGGLGFCVLVGVITLHMTRRFEIGALVYADIAFKVAAVVWVGLFLWLAPISISVGVSQ